MIQKMRNTDFIDMSDGTQPFEGLVPAFGKQMGEKYMTGKREGATDYLEVVDCEAVKDYIEENVPTPEFEGQFASFDGFIVETALSEESEEEAEEQKPEEQETEEPKEEDTDEPVDEPTEEDQNEEPVVEPSSGSTEPAE